MKKLLYMIILIALAITIISIYQPNKDTVIYRVTYIFEDDKHIEHYLVKDSVELQQCIDNFIEDAVVDRDIFEFPIAIIRTKI